MSQKALLLDRDGTLIIDKNYLNDPKDIEYFPELFENFKKLKQAGFLFIVVTNQSGIPRGLVTEEQMQSIHDQIQKDFKSQGLKITQFYHSPHLPESNHPLRKPNPGMLLEAQKDHHLDLSKCWMIGDKDIDVFAGEKVNSKTLLFETRVDRYESLTPTYRSPNWSDATQKILSHVD